MTNDADTPAQGWATRLRQSADHDGIQELRMVMRRVATEIERHSPAESAPGHTDLMVTPESIDAFLEKNPPPDDRSQPESGPTILDRAIASRLEWRRRAEQAEAQVEKMTLDLAYCREAMRFADIDLSMILPEVANLEVQRSIRKTLDRIDEARRLSLTSTVQQPPQQQNDAG